MAAPRKSKASDEAGGAVILSDAEALDVVERGIALHNERKELEAQAEADAAQARLDAEAEKVKEQLTDARKRFSAARDARFQHLVAVLPLHDSYRASQEAYRAIQRRARALGIEDDAPEYDIPTKANTQAGYELRAQMKALQTVLRSGL